MIPLRLDSVGLGETEANEIALQLAVGEVELAFMISRGMSRELGQALMTLSAPATRQPAN